ncbi:hypothetical protein EBT25_05480 [bacterium]|jgi:hypothetical protein|nr:hypothetical protein [bacterium]
MKIAIYNGFPFHYEVIGHILEYCKSREYKVTVYSVTNNNWGWFDFYGVQPYPVNEYTHEKYDRVFLLTDDDWSFPYTPDEKITCLEHVNYQRRSGDIKRVTFKHREGVPFIYFTFSIPRVPKSSTVRVGILGGGKEQEIKFPVEVIRFGRDNPIQADEMLRILSTCHYLFLKNFTKSRWSSSGTLSMAFTCGCRLLTTKDIIDEYKLKSAVDYDATDTLLPLDPGDVYEEAEQIIRQKNEVYD